MIMKLAKIVTINNVKGGVGKTTTAVNLAAGLARKGKKVLLIDSDSQANATTAILKQKVGRTIKDLFQGADVKEVIYHSDENGLDVVPSCLALAVIEPELMSKYARETILKRALDPIRQDYDFIIIDTQPSVSVFPMNALCAANEVIVPVYEAFAVDAITQMINILTAIRQNGLNPNLMIRGILLTKYDSRTNMSKEIKSRLVDKFGQAVFDTVIPQNVKLIECTRKTQSIYEYAPESAGAIKYREFTEELMKRWGML